MTGGLHNHPIRRRTRQWSDETHRQIGYAFCAAGAFWLIFAAVVELIPGS